MRVFFDTNVIRYFGQAFAADPLDDRLRGHIVLSPVSLLEVISQLALETRRQAFEAIQAMWNWLPERAGVLDLPPIFIREAVGQNADPDGNSTFSNVTNAVQRCLYATSADTLVEPAAQLRRFIESAKSRNAETRRDAVSAMRAALKQERRRISEEELRKAFRISLANRARVDSEDEAVGRFADKLAAYYSYDTQALKIALLMPEYNFLSKKRKNDLFDSEQLLYLAYPDICFLTTDRGYKRVTTIEQGDRVRLVDKSTVCDRRTAVEELERIVMG